VCAPVLPKYRWVGNRTGIRTRAYPRVSGDGSTRGSTPTGSRDPSTYPHKKSIAQNEKIHTGRGAPVCAPVLPKYRWVGNRTGIRARTEPHIGGDGSTRGSTPTRDGGISWCQDLSSKKIDSPKRGKSPPVGAHPCVRPRYPNIDESTPTEPCVRPPHPTASTPQPPPTANGPIQATAPDTPAPRGTARCAIHNRCAPAPGKTPGGRPSTPQAN